MNLVILDRDGVINHDSPHFVKSVDEWVAIPGSIEAIAKLHRQGFSVAVATNQSGISRGLIAPENLLSIHHRLLQLVKEAGGNITKIVFCPHGPEDNCLCRKPRAGLIDQLFNELGQPEKSWMVGDSLRDLEAGASRGCIPILVKTGKGEDTYRQKLPVGTQVFTNLAEASNWLIKNFAD